MRCGRIYPVGIGRICRKRARRHCYRDQGGRHVSFQRSRIECRNYREGTARLHKLPQRQGRRRRTEDQLYRARRRIQSAEGCRADSASGRERRDRIPLQPARNTQHRGDREISGGAQGSQHRHPERRECIYAVPRLSLYHDSSSELRHRRTHLREISEEGAAA